MKVLLEIEVPEIPESINSAYGQTRNKRRFLKKRSTNFKTLVYIEFLKKRITLEKREYKLELIFYKNWYSKSGSPLKKDVSNLIKIAEDAISEAINIDDSYFFNVSAQKIHSNDLKTIIKLLL